jgi:hypothetical protein
VVSSRELTRSFATTSQYVFPTPDESGDFACHTPGLRDLGSPGAMLQELRSTAAWAPGGMEGVPAAPTDRGAAAAASSATRDRSREVDP